ncbi:hypothetical protein KR044_009453 [Drosophila immigrans]|nr:hypothetical protein KR044_009453 [Drosophila immigrans]
MLNLFPGALQFLLILIFLSQPSQTLFNVDKMRGVLGFIQEAEAIVSKVRWDIEVLDTDTGEFDNSKMRDNQIIVLQHFKEISMQIDQLEKNHIKTPMQSIYAYISRNNTELEEMHNMIDDVEMVSEEFDKFKNIANSGNDTYIFSFVEEITRSDKNIFLNNDFYLKLLGAPYNSKELLNELRQRHEMPLEKICHSLQSPQQLVYSLYKHIALTELKAYIQIEYLLVIRRVSGQGNFIIETNKVRINYKTIREEALCTLKDTMRQADRVVWRCDPEKHVHKVTYDEVTRLLQGYVENEVDLNNDESCSQTCPDYQNTTTMGCFDQKFCSQQPKCSGRIHNCQFVDSDLSVCQSPESSNRRYEYIQYSNGQRFGEHETCWRDVNNVESWRRIFSKCSYCFCLCDEQGPKSDRFFNLRDTLSDVRANKVVTGVRFVKKNRIFHIQIQQGQLLPRGAINESTVEWVPIDDYKIDDFNVTEGVDYHSMNYETRRMNLGETIFEYGTLIVTGVRFVGRWGRLAVEVTFSRLKFEKGQVFGYNLEEIKIPSTVISIWNSGIDSQKFNTDNLDLPTRSTHSSQPLSKNRQYLEFVNTGIEKDAAQTTIPFIDIQDVVSNPPVPLAGIGIYYKSSPGYGGFVAPKIISYDISPHVQNVHSAYL